MRFAWALGESIGDAAAEAVAAEAHGFDAVWVGDDALASTAVAASLAPSTVGLRVVVAATVGHDHPVELAEQVAVADLTLNGRLVLAVRPADDAVDRLGEVLDLLADCFGAHPFRSDGPVWPTPANLPSNVFNVEDGSGLPHRRPSSSSRVWVAGAAGRAAAVERALGVVFDAAEPARRRRELVGGDVHGSADAGPADPPGGALGGAHGRRRGSPSTLPSASCEGCSVPSISILSSPLPSRPRRRRGRADGRADAARSVPASSSTATRPGSRSTGPSLTQEEPPMAEAYIVDAVRTPVGKRGGGLSQVHPADLGAHVHRARWSSAPASTRRRSTT